MRHRNLRKVLIERFSDNLSTFAVNQIEMVEDDTGTRLHVQQFMETVEARRQQILEKVLLDES